MCAQPKQRQSHVYRLLAILAICATAFAASLSPLAVKKAYAADCTQPTQPLTCLTIAKAADTNYVLDIAGGSTSVEAAVQLYGANATQAQQFRFNVVDNDSDPDRGYFQIINLRSGLCFDTYSQHLAPTVHGTPFVNQQNCADSDTQLWYLQPYNNSGYMIRNKGDDNCIDQLGGNTSSIDTYPCSGDNSQRWNIYDLYDGGGWSRADWPAGNNARYLNLAALRGMTRCGQADSTYCKWNIVSRGSTYFGQPVCPGSAYHQGSGAVGLYSKSESSIYSATVGSSIRKESTLGAELSIGEGAFKASISKTFSDYWESSLSSTTGTTTTWTQGANQTTTGPNEYTWVVERPLKQDLTGHYTFDPLGKPWNYDGKIIANLGSGSSTTTSATWGTGPGWILPTVCASFPTGPIRIASVNKCVDIPNGNNTAGSRVQIWSCVSGSANQKWVKQSNNTLVALNRCLDVQNGSTADSSPVVINGCNGAASQKWEAYNGALRNIKSGKCLNTQYGALTDGTKLAVDVAYDGHSAQERLAGNDYDVLVLDRDLPDVHGDEICRELAATGARTRILMLTAAGSLTDRVQGPRLGADDYLPKPFEYDELVARIQALGRRSQPALPPVLERGGIILDPAHRQVHRHGRYLALSRKEYAALEVLLRARGAVVSAEELLERAWDENADPFTTTVRVTISRLRSKLGDPPVIETLPGIGYRI